MLATLIIVFREVLEAALVVSIVLAATRGLSRRGAWVSAGVAGGILGALIVAAFADRLAGAISGAGQEVFNAGVLFVAVAMLGWHNVWMSRHGREMAASLRGIGAAVISGTRPMYVLAIVVGMAVLREGAELVLFLYGIAASASGDTGGMLTGALLGLGAGAALGAALYLGLLRIPSAHLFTVTGWMVVLLAAGMAAQGAAYLVQADILPTLGDSLWDTSAVLADDSLPGRILHVLVGYSARPYGIQVLFYIGTACAIIGMTKAVSAKAKPSTPTGTRIKAQPAN